MGEVSVSCCGDDLGPGPSQQNDSPAGSLDRSAAFAPNGGWIGDASMDAQKDALSDVLNLVGLTGGVFMDADFTAPWSVAGKVSPELCKPFMAPPDHILAFHYVVEGPLFVTFEDGFTAQAQAGEIIMLP